MLDTVMNWDDLKYFLAVARAGSIRGAAKNLDVSHATVSRRINNFEQQIGFQLFNRSGNGYEKTRAGEEIYAQAVHLEETLYNVHRLAGGKDKALSGPIRVTAADIVAEHLLIDPIASFARLYPNIDIHILDSVRSLNLANREADIAIRVCQSPPEHLIAHRLAGVHRAAYTHISNKDLIMDQGWLARQHWIGWTDKMRKPIGQMAKDYPDFGSKHGIVNTNLMVKACKHNMGIAILPCFIGDSDKDLIRVSPFTSEHKFELFMLVHPDLRNNAKVKEFRNYMLDAIKEKRTLIEGQCPLHGIKEVKFLV